MTTAQIQETEDITNGVAKNDDEVYYKNAALGEAKAIQGLRAVFDEVGCSVTHSIVWYCALLAETFANPSSYFLKRI
jgi:hypothetical protein